MNRSIVLGWTGVILALAWPAFAEGDSGETKSHVGDGERRPAVAPPGQCAEPRTAIDARTGDEFSVVGPVTALFDPIDVAAGPSIAGDPSLRPAPPTARPLARPGACDQPGSGCSAPVASRTVIEPPPGGGGFPSQGPQ